MHTLSLIHIFGKKLGLSEEDLKTLRIGGLFHDIGKIGVPDSILLKDAKLTDDEYSQIKNHPSIGAHILSSAKIFENIIPIVKHHHEKYDGNGYPSKLRGEEIPFLARIAAVADTFDAMTSVRPVSYTHLLETITPIKKSPYYKTSSAQKRIYYASQVSGESSLSYNISGGVILDSPLNINKLQNCVNQLVKRHFSLQTYFEVEDNEIVQKIDTTASIGIETVACEENQLEKVFQTFAKPFDLSQAPLARFMYVDFGNGKSAFLINTHHIIADGTSMSLLIDELCKLYNKVELPIQSHHYIDFAN